MSEPAESFTEAVKEPMTKLVISADEDPSMDSATEAVNKPKTELIMWTEDDDPFAKSATPLSGRVKGFPVMPGTHNMLPGWSQPTYNDGDRCRPRNGPSIDEWKAALIGKRLVRGDAEDGDNVG